MKNTRIALALTLILLGFLATEPALAGPHRHGGVRFSVAVGVPFGYGYGYYGYYPGPYYAPSYYAPYYPRYYYPPVVSAPYTPPTYIEQNAPQPAPQAAPASPAAQNYWYYCADSNAYYPYVNQCAGGWQRVSPTPAPGG